MTLLKNDGMKCVIIMCIHWIYPPPSNNHHQDHEPFLVGNPCKPSFVTVTGWGGRPNVYIYIYIYIIYIYILYIYMGNVHIKNPGCFFSTATQTTQGFKEKSQHFRGANTRDPKTMKTTNVWLVIPNQREEWSLQVAL